MIDPQKHNEADVEVLVVEKFIEQHGYFGEDIKRKKTITTKSIGMGRSAISYRPDYVLYCNDYPVVIIEAKSPSEKIEKWVHQPQSYALRLNADYPPGFNPCSWCVITNGIELSVYKWDNDTVFHKVENISSVKDMFLEELSAEKQSSIIERSITNIDVAGEKTLFIKPPIDTIQSIFSDIHNLIWKMEQLSPTDAFYEFVKLFVLKMDSDKSVNKKLREAGSNDSIKRNDIYFSLSYIKKEREASSSAQHPLKVKFETYVKDFENDIKRHKKKRIFEESAKIELNDNTIDQIVEKLELYNLHNLDEDLNGRMFEIFLNASVRGKELGQYFTPRGVVKGMIKMANLDPLAGDRVLDACCGSGGFLIESLSEMLEKAKHDKNKSKIEDKIKNDLIVGVDSVKKVVMTARMNMYIHKDGSSKIFHYNSLDKDIERAITNEKDPENEYQKKELKSILKDNSFDVVLTNPPFATKYENKPDKGGRILKKYNLLHTLKRKNYNSNILFIERYFDLLKGGGRLLTVIDDSLLNGKNQSVYRKWIKDRFYVRAVISLPFNAFINASTTIKTSVLFLEKKESEKLIEQTSKNIFMAICNNIGHDDKGRDTKERNNLPLVVNHYQKFIRGEMYEDVVSDVNMKKGEVLTCPMQVFKISHEEFYKNDRWDAFYYSPELRRTQDKIKALSGDKFELRKGNDFEKIKEISKDKSMRNRSNRYRYVEVGSVDKNGYYFISTRDFLSELPTRARINVKKHTIIVPKSISCLGSVAIIMEDADDLLVSTGFIAIKCKHEEQAISLWAVIRSEIIQKQMFYLSATAVQPEVSNEIFNKDLLIPYPINKMRKEIYTLAKSSLIKKEEYEKTVSDLNTYTNTTFM